MKTLTILALFVTVVAVSADDTCPNFRDWMPWTDKCLWFPFEQMRDDMIQACGVTFTGELPTLPPPPANFPTDQCGHCSFKFRCRKREQSDDCSPIDAEVEHCHDGSKGGICTLPKIEHADLGCKYAVVPYWLMQCANRPDVPDWRRDQMTKWGDIVPKFHCLPGENDCKCCCHPYQPNADGTACEMYEEPTCEPFSDWKGWSDKCLFFPPKEMKKDVEEHCDFQFPKKMKNPVMDKFKLPGGIEPSRCGMCSFKINCRTRPVNSAAGKKECFPLDMQKKACGNEECEGCGDVCELPKIGNDCDYSKKIKKLLGPAIKSRLKKAPPSMRHGMIKALSGMPHGKCIEKDGKCKCCCHPYEPNAEGTECVVKSMCQTPEEAGVEVDLNLDDSLWFW
jgi:hypothetical protein